MSELQIEGQELKVASKPLAWELTAPELIYPFTLQVGAKTLPLFVHMKPYRAYDLKQLLADTAYSVKFEDEETSEIVKANRGKIDAFFWKHFARLSGHGRTQESGDPDFEQQKKWITDHPRFDIPQKAVMDGFGGISTKRAPQGDEETANGNGHSENATLDLFTMDLDVTTSVPLTQRICLPDVGVVQIEMQHHFRRESATEYQRYERATDKQVINRKRQSYQRATNHSVIEELYNELIQSVDGMTNKGQPCEVATKQEWVEHVPYWHKQLALLDFFSGVQSKNG